MEITTIELKNNQLIKVTIDTVNGIRFGNLRLWTRRNQFKNLEPNTRCFSFNLNCVDDLIVALIKLSAFNHSLKNKA